MKDSQALILAFNKRFSQADQVRKYTALQQNTFRFYRGTCHLFYDRLAAIGMPKDHSKAWICGDLHLENFGSYKGDNRLVYFDISDFDEALLAPLSFDVLRFTTAILLASDEFQYSQKHARELAANALREYYHTVINAKALMMEREVASGLMRDFFEQVSSQSREAFIKKITKKEGQKLRLIIDNVHTRKMDDDVKDRLIDWFHHEFKDTSVLGDMEVNDCAYRLAGTGSIGCERYIMIVYDRRKEKYYLLDIKEARPSSLKKYVDIKRPKWQHDAERIVTIQNRMQFCSPALLRPVCFRDKWFVLRELQPVQDKMDLLLCKGKLDKLEDVLYPMAHITGYAHLRASGRHGSSSADELIESISRPKWQKQMFELSEALCDQIEKDYKQFRKFSVSSIS